MKPSEATTLPGELKVMNGFTSTGKERDEETGYGYFGARYYDADILTGWLSIDLMADKHLASVLMPTARGRW